MFTVFISLWGFFKIGCLYIWGKIIFALITVKLWEQIMQRSIEVFLAGSIQGLT